MRQPDSSTRDILDRREFIGVCMCTVSGLALGGCASLMTRAVTPVDGKVVLNLMHYPELTEPGRSLKLLPAGHAEPVYVMVHRDGSVVALSPVCTHLGCTVEIQGERLVCPCHGSTYDASGAVLQGPAEKALARYPTSLTSDGLLTIDLRSRA